MNFTSTEYIEQGRRRASGNGSLLRKGFLVPSEGTFALSAVGKSQRRQVTERHIVQSIVQATMPEDFYAKLE